MPERRGLWARLTDSPELAARHGVAGLLPPEAAPAALQPELRRLLISGRRHRALTLAVVDALSAARVTPTMLKGYALALRLYPRAPLLRPASDVDVLVDRTALERSVTALGSLGLRELRFSSLADPLEEHHHLSLVRHDEVVELHFRLFAGFGGGDFDMEALRARALPFRLEGRTVWLLSPEDEFLYLATHAANHAFMRLGWLLDLQRYLVTAPNLDWGLMAVRAERAGFVTAVTTALDLLERLLGLALPLGARRHFSNRSRRPLTSMFFSESRVLNATLSTNALAAFLIRGSMVDTPAHGVRHLLDGATRYFRRKSKER